MGIKKLFSSLFGAGGNSGGNSSAADYSAQAEQYKGFTITPTPIAEGSQFRTAGTISRMPAGADSTRTDSASDDGADAVADAAPQTSKFVRADLQNSLDQAITHTISKGRQIIDERGERVFDSERC